MSSIIEVYVEDKARKIDYDILQSFLSDVDKGLLKIELFDDAINFIDNGLTVMRLVLSRHIQYEINEKAMLRTLNSAMFKSNLNEKEALMVRLLKPVIEKMDFGYVEGLSRNSDNIIIKIIRSLKSRYHEELVLHGEGTPFETEVLDDYDYFYIDEVVDFMSKF